MDDRSPNNNDQVMLMVKTAAWDIEIYELRLGFGIQIMLRLQLLKS